MLRTENLYLGLLSGTSLDSIDHVLAAISATGQPRQLAAWHQPIPTALRQQLATLCQPGPDELNRAGQASQAFAQLCAEGVQLFLEQQGLTPEQISAIGFHGQTVRHHPNGSTGFTWQLGEPARLAVATGIPVVGQFRPVDIALGGQGAPLAPALHQLLMATETCPVALVNLGGIANLTVIGPAGELIGFDSGPANTLLDQWSEQHQGLPFDDGGQWAASGTVHEPLLRLLLDDPYFQRPWPKSTGREYFHPGWIQQQLAKLPATPEACDVQATLLELTARTLTAALQQAGTPNRVYVAGGGVHNTHLLQRCAALLPASHWDSVAVLGIDPDGLEGVLFAWLASCHVRSQAIDLGPVTGARQAMVPGAWFPAPGRATPGS